MLLYWMSDQVGRLLVYKMHNTLEEQLLLSLQFIFFFVCFCSAVMIYSLSLIETPCKCQLLCHSIKTCHDLCLHLPHSPLRLFFTRHYELFLPKLSAVAVPAVSLFCFVLFFISNSLTSLLLDICLSFSASLSSHKTHSYYSCNTGLQTRGH